jgi:hypothetical protein
LEHIMRAVVVVADMEVLEVLEVVAVAVMVVDQIQMEVMVLQTAAEAAVARHHHWVGVQAIISAATAVQA